MINNHNEFINYLYTFQDTKYRDFHKKLILTDNLIGIRTPILKKIAKEISKNDYKKFIKFNKHSLYEENILHGLLLGYLKLDFSDLKPLLDEFLPYIDNWATCDLTASNLKIFAKLGDIGFNEIKYYIKSNNCWINRFGYVLLLDYYVNDLYIDKIFMLCENYKDEYYIKMAIAWLLSICYIKYKDKTLKYLSKSKLDKWTYNKTIQKIIESNRISKEEKDKLRSMKIK